MTPEWLAAQAETVERQRVEMLFAEDEGGVDSGDDPEAEQFFLLALAAQDQAHRYLKLAQLKQTQAIAAMQRENF